MRLLLLLCVFLLFAGCSRPAQPGIAHKTVGDLAVTLSADPPPHIGDNMFQVTLADSVTHGPLGNANITAKPEMLAPSGVGSESSGRAQGNGVYVIPVRLGIATRYDLALHIERSGKPSADVFFPIEAVQ